jgi:hypothetical protein
MMWKGGIAIMSTDVLNHVSPTLANTLYWMLEKYDL